MDSGPFQCVLDKMHLVTICEHSPSLCCFPFCLDATKVYCPEHVKYVRTPLDAVAHGKPIQIGPRNRMQAQDRILPKLLLGGLFLPLPAPGGSRSAKASQKCQVCRMSLPPKQCVIDDD